MPASSMSTPTTVKEDRGASQKCLAQGAPAGWGVLTMIMRNGAISPISDLCMRPWGGAPSNFAAEVKPGKWLGDRLPAPHPLQMLIFTITQPILGARPYPEAVPGASLTLRCMTSPLKRGLAHGAAMAATGGGSAMAAPKRRRFRPNEGASAQTKALVRIGHSPKRRRVGGGAGKDPPFSISVKCPTCAYIHPW